MSPWGARMARLPLRLRLVAGFSVATFLVLLAAGAFVYWRVEYALDQDLDAELSEALGTIQPLVGADGRVAGPAEADATGVAWQVLDADGHVIDSGGAASPASFLDARRLAGVGTSPQTFEVGAFLPASHAPYRVQVVRAQTAPDHYVLVGERRDHRDEALRELLLQLSLAGIGTLLVTAFVGERLAHAALRPVERYRRSAAAIATGGPERRLDVPPLRDDEVTRLGHTFNDMLATLDRALERERQFVAEASHELRTPITLLKSRVQLARRRSRSVEEHERILGELELDLDRLARLAEQLLQLATVTAEHEPGDISAVARRVVAERDVDLETATTHSVRLSDVKLERILTNLLDNAATHGAPPIRVVVDQPDPGWVRVVVSDGGLGMTSELLASATQRFTRADEARARPGAGLGLALVRSLVEQAGGQLRLCYDGNHGAVGESWPAACLHSGLMTVTVLLPTAP
ncbi:sensor histidine kinase [Nocardioides sp. MH1]|uniref:sensor histidine kinase n=1 Tax=Nocardioides sp. MH1 TaxID=3242490 RepID=UPI003521557B